MNNSDSILESIRHTCGLGDEHVFFDDDLIMHINSTFDVIHQLGAGPDEGFAIVDESATWNDYFSGHVTIEFIKTYVYICTKLVFDPPQNSFLVKALEDQKKEYEWRINVASENLLWKTEVKT